jgi:hypothetical protein
VKVGGMMNPRRFSIHSNNDAKKTANFGHKPI